MSFVLSGVIIFLSVLHLLERRDLYNRIMSKDYHEYKSDSPKHGPSAHVRKLDEWRRKGG